MLAQGYLPNSFPDVAACCSSKPREFPRRPQLHLLKARLLIIPHKGSSEHPGTFDSH
jgi:hypothetical protein